MSEARKQLTDAFAKVQGIENTIMNLGHAKTSAQVILGNSTARLQGFTNLDKEITKFRVDAVKSGLGTQSLPDLIKQKVAAKRDAEDELSQAQDTLAALEDELKTAQASLKPAQKAQFKAALAVLRETVGGTAQELIELNKRQYELMQIVLSLQNLTYPSDAGWMTVGATKTMAEALDFHPPQFMSNHDPIKEMGKRWKTRLDALLDNPDASLTIPTPMTPSDFTYTISTPESPDGRFMLPVGSTTVRPEA